MTAPFFARRFAGMVWTILTPERSAHWDGSELTFLPGATKDMRPEGDDMEALWLTYYASIFNPARLKVNAMRAEMPKKYWANMPETALIKPLIAGAEAASRRMIETAPTLPSLRNERQKERDMARQPELPTQVDPAVLVAGGSLLHDDFRVSGAGRIRCRLVRFRKDYGSPWQRATSALGD